jgi:hypothetical protein
MSTERERRLVEEFLSQVGKNDQPARPN